MCFCCSWVLLALTQVWRGRRIYGFTGVLGLGGMSHGRAVGFLMLRCFLCRLSEALDKQRIALEHPIHLKYRLRDSGVWEPGMVSASMTAIYASPIIIGPFEARPSFAPPGWKHSSWKHKRRQGGVDTVEPKNLQTPKLGYPDLRTC